MPRLTQSQVKLLRALTVVVTADGQPTDILRDRHLDRWWYGEASLRYCGWIRKQTIESVVRRGWAERNGHDLRITQLGIDQLR